MNALADAPHAEAAAAQSNPLRRRYTAAACLAMMSVLGAARAMAAEPLSDGQLDAVTAGAADEAQSLLEFNAVHESVSGRRVQVDGAIDIARARSIENAALELNDSAQSNLQSLININAVQSAVNVLVNLNITVDSNVGEIHQLNLGSIPAPPVSQGP